MSNWKLSFDSSPYEEVVSEQFLNLSHLKVDDVHQKNFCDHPISPQTLLTLGVPGVENHEPKVGTNYSSLSSSIENLHKESRGRKRESCGEDLVFEFDANNDGSGMTSRRNEDGLQQYSKASCGEMHKMKERRRRNRIAKNVKILKELIPNCNKSDRASVLDQVIQHIQDLQHQVQVMSMDRIPTWHSASTQVAGRNQIMHFNPYIMPRISFGYFFGSQKSINYSSMFSSYFSPMMSTGSQFPFFPLSVANNLLHLMPESEKRT